jgi:alkaline phosphatase
MSFNRRGFIKRVGLGALPAVGFPQVMVAAERGMAPPGERPRRIIHLVADGLSHGTLTCTDHFSVFTRGRPLTWVTLMNRPGASFAWVNMRSLNSLVTDSAAAASSWGSGSRVTNGALNWLPDGRSLHTLYQLFADRRWKRGLVTTTEITHATPAGFAASISNRDKAEAIAEQYLEQKIDVLLGGGAKYFDPKKRADKRDLTGEFKAQGYAVCQAAADLSGAPTGKPCLGLFASSHLPYTLDLAGNAKQRAQVPTLAAMTRTALAHLQGASHFILQIEGGRVDHGAHNCDMAAAVHELLALDEAIDVCLEYQARVPETLIVITVDHGNGNPGLTGSGPKDGSNSRIMANLKQIRCSFPEILKPLSTSSSPEAIRERVHDTTGYDVSLERAKTFAAAVQKKNRPVSDALNSATAQLGQLLSNYLGINFSSGSHTSDYVPLLAIGPGAERFRGFIQNTEVFSHYLALARIDHRNPQLPLMAEETPDASDVEDVAAYAETCETALA